ncbi:DUF1538 family protein [Geoalkalibacter halelectricus]|uniref:DUF1538 family protein n=1 Tax=Geoalkalibacter halelectricus TaxID=2847045 RepID=UPI003D2484EA
MSSLIAAFFSAARDVLPIALVLFAFQYLVLRRPFPRVSRVVTGFLLMLIGLTLLLLGLEKAVFTLGASLTEQLLDLAGGGEGNGAAWRIFLCLGTFSAAVAFAAVFAEPVLSAFSQRAQQISGGTIDALRLRLVVASGAALGTALGVLRILWGGHIGYFLLPVIVLILVLSRQTPGAIRPLAFDLGVAGVSTILVPLLVAIGAGLALAIPDRSPLADGFGLVAHAALMPVATVMLYARAAHCAAQRSTD